METDAQPSTVLLVEDELLLRRTLCESLQESGFAVETAPTADTAWRMVADGLPFDVLVTDVRMPGLMDGIDLAKKVKEERRDVRVIVMSGFTALTNFDSRIGTFLSKPFTAAKLTTAISANTAS